MADRVVSLDEQVVDELHLDGETLAEVSCRDTVFEGPVSLRNARLNNGLTMTGATFKAEVDFTGCTSLGDLDLSECVFKQATSLGDLFIADHHRLNLDRVIARGPLAVNVNTRNVGAGGEMVGGGMLAVSCYRADFTQGLHLWANHAFVLLERARFGGPSTVWAPGGYTDLMSLWGTDCTNLTVSGLDLSHCQFVGAINLDKLVIDMWPTALVDPIGFGLTARRYLYDEIIWRRGHENVLEDRPLFPRMWLPYQLSDWGPSAHEVASAYRALRKGREEAKDEPGAGNFYYGEMEMRRHSTNIRSERWLLWLYWAVSGYGLRASRALALLLAVLLGGAGLLAGFGFPESRSYGSSLLYAVETTVGIARDTPTTTAGDVLRIVFRILLPLLAGLVLLAIRGRVKR